MNENFFKGRKILITGNTGFKGSWLSQILLMAGADICGYALRPSADQPLFSLLGLEKEMPTCFEDIRDFEALDGFIRQEQPEIVFHLAAQPIVRESYRSPRDTYETNVMGTVNLLESVRQCGSVRSLVNVTTDKVYENREWEWGYREADPLNGFDPYSNSKSCSELVTHSYRKSFLENMQIAVSTARAGNVIGGGDFAGDRIIPDCVRAAMRGQQITVRNPASVRPYQHVLEPLKAYLMIARRQYADAGLAGSYNVGPGEEGCISTGQLVELFCAKWRGSIGWRVQGDGGPHEAGYLKLDCSRIRKELGWKPVWTIEQAVDAVVEWTEAYAAKGSVRDCMCRQIKAFFE